MKLNKDQENAANKIVDFIEGRLDLPFFTLTGSPGSGKALANSEPVLTPQGFIENKYLKVGDKVIGANGKAANILGIYPQGKRDIYKLKFSDGTFSRCDIDHIWRVYRYGKWSNKSLKKIMSTLLYGERFDKRYNTIQRKYNFYIPLTEAVEYDIQNDLPIDPYTLGVLLGDGGFTGNSVSVTLNNKFDISTLKLPDFIKLTTSAVEDKCITYRLTQVKRKKFSDITKLFKELGLYGKKSIEKHIPKQYLTASIKARKALLQGLLITDGHVVKNGSVNSNEFSTSSKQLKNDISELLHSLGIYNRIVDRIPIFTHKGVKKEGAKNYRIYINFNKHKKSIVSIEKDGVENATCIKIDAKDSLYLTRDFIVTHNTVLLKEALSRTSMYMFDRSAAAVAHAAKNVISESFDHSIPCYTVAQWLGMRVFYSDTGEIIFKRDKKSVAKLKSYKIAILDEASMINDELYDEIMQIVTNYKIKLITIGDTSQLAPVKQEHDSKFFDKIDAELTIPMRFTGPIANLTEIYRQEIESINNGYSGNIFALNEGTSRKDVYNEELDSGYYFKNNIYELVEQVGDEIKNNPNNLNFSRMLAYKNSTVDLLNRNVRKYIYGKNLKQFEQGEIVISRGGFTVDKQAIIHNGKLLRVETTKPISGPFNIPCVSMKFKDFDTQTNVIVVEYNQYALQKYNNIKDSLLRNAKRDFKQWVYYYKFIDSFAYFDYGYSLSAYKSQGQTLTNVYVMEGEIMQVKPLTLKQKFQALYVAMTRASKNLYIYNKDY